LFYEKSVILQARRRACFSSDVRASVWAAKEDFKSWIEPLLELGKEGE